jgi:hypothetical protein
MFGLIKGETRCCRAFVPNAPASHRMEPADAERHRRAGRRPSEWGTSESTALKFQLLTKDSFERAESIVGVTVRPLAESEW